MARDVYDLVTGGEDAEERKPYFERKDEELEQRIAQAKEYGPGSVFGEYYDGKKFSEDAARRLFDKNVKSGLHYQMSYRGSAPIDQYEWRQRLEKTVEGHRQVAANGFVAKTPQEGFQYLFHQSRGSLADSALNRLESPETALRHSKAVAERMYELGYEPKEIQTAMLEADPQMAGWSLDSVWSSTRDIAKSYLNESLAGLKDADRRPALEARRQQIAAWREAHGVSPQDRRAPGDYLLAQDPTAGKFPDQDLAEVLSRIGHDPSWQQAWQERLDAARRGANTVWENGYEAKSAGEKFQYLLNERVREHGDKTVDRVKKPYTTLRISREIANELYVNGYGPKEIRDAFRAHDPTMVGLESAASHSGYYREDMSKRYLDLVMNETHTDELRQQREALVQWRLAHGVPLDDRRSPQEYMQGMGKRVADELETRPTLEPDAKGEFLRQVGEQVKATWKDTPNAGFRDATGLPPTESIALRMHGAGFTQQEINEAIRFGDPAITELSNEDKEIYIQSNITPLLESEQARQFRNSMDYWRERLNIPIEIRRFDRLERLDTAPQRDHLKDLEDDTIQPGLDDSLFDDF